MKICLVATHISQSCGIASYTSYLAEGLHATDPSVAVALLAEGGVSSCLNDPLPVVGTFAGDEDYPAAVLSQIEACAPDIVHIQHEYGIFGLDERFHRLLAQLRARGVRTVVTLHTVHTKLSFSPGCPRPPRPQPSMRTMLRKIDIESYQRRIGEFADCVIVHQESTIRQILVRQGVDSQRVVTIPHGTRVRKAIDSHSAKIALGLEPDAPLVVAFGYFETSKNILLLIEAFRRVKSRVPAAKLWLGGHMRYPTPQTSIYWRRCQQAIEAADLQDDVVFSSTSVPEEQVPCVLSAADVACFIYREDTRSSSGALHLALGLRKPVLVSRIPKFQEVAEISDELLVDPRAAGESSRLLSRLLLDMSFRESIEQNVGSFARRTAWPVVAAEHYSLYQRLIRAD